MATVPARFSAWIAESCGSQAAHTLNDVGHDLRCGGGGLHAFHWSWSPTESHGIHRAVGCEEPDRRGARGQQLAGNAEGTKAFPGTVFPGSTGDSCQR